MCVFRVYKFFAYSRLQARSPSLTVQAFYEENCEGVGCDIAGNADCRRCIFDNTAYEAVSRQIASSAFVRSFLPARTITLTVETQTKLLPARSKSGLASPQMQATEDLRSQLLAARTTSARNQLVPPTHPFLRRLIVYQHLQSTGSEGQALVDCPCCVPITYKLRPGDSECVWPATPSPTPAPTTYEEFLENSGGAPSRPRGLTVAAAAAGAPLAMIAATVAVGVATACFVASIEVAGSHDPWVKTEMPRGKPA